MNTFVRTMSTHFTVSRFTIMKDLILVAIAALVVLALMIFQLRWLRRIHPNAKLLIGILNQLR